MDNLISIIVPVYKVEAYLRKCIDSILNQTYKNLQIILVDDGSPDNSGAICDEYAQKDNRIQVIHKENGGVTSARQAGLDLVKGEYVGFVDSDDWIEANMYEEMLENLIQTGADFVHTGIINEKKSVNFTDCQFENCVVEYPINNIEIWKSFINIHDKFKLNSFLYTKLFKRELITYCFKNVRQEICYGEDRIAITECLLMCKKFSLLKKAYYHYIFRKDSYTAVHGSTEIFNVVEMYKEMFELFKKYNIYDSMKNYLETALTLRLLSAINDGKIYPNRICISKYKNINELYGKKIILYGAGAIGYDYHCQLSQDKNIQIVDWIDKNYLKYNYLERKVISVDNIKNYDYDLILIAVKKQGLADKIIDELISIGVDEKKIYWKSPIQLLFEN